ncbi:hypothetical protein PWT90_07369 [Aphanocladium album]|nr:hypothetical protein PWT90_07369 [Aphanocladium album]
MDQQQSLVPTDSKSDAPSTKGYKTVEIEPHWLNDQQEREIEESVKELAGVQFFRIIENYGFAEAELSLDHEAKENEVIKALTENKVIFSSKNPEWIPRKGSVW